MAYAAIVSLKQTIKRLLHPSESRNFLPNSEVESIYKDVCSLQSFLEKFSSLQNSERVGALERRIKDAIHKAEDLIEFHLSDRFLSKFESSRDESLTLVFSQELLKVKQEITNLTETVKNKDDYYTEHQKQSKSSAADSASSRIYPFWNSNVVGLENERSQLKRSLLVGSSKRHIISIVGMAGIGKTTLAREVYSDPYVQDNFPHRCFVTIGPNHQLEETLLNILFQMNDTFEQTKSKDLGLDLHRFLFSRKYLIVLDDIWDTQVWEQLRKYIPDKQNGSRIIFTTRLVDVAHKVGSLLKIPFLNDEESWNLLRDSAFTAKEPIDPQLEVIGKKIAKTCEGLPLAIVVAGGILQEMEKTVEKWKSVAEDENYIIAPISEILYLSYKELPQCLKACFLYMGVFPQSYEILISKLVQFWVAEGFLEAERGKSLDETAEKCLNDLVSRSLVILGQQSSRGRTKTCRIHFVYRNLCVNEARNEKFFHVVKKLLSSFPEGTNSQRRLCIHNNNVLGLKQVQNSLKSVSAARSLLCFGAELHHGLRVYLNYKLLKVLDGLKIRFYEFPVEALILVQLRYLAITYDGEVPGSISRLRNLVVLIVHRHQRIKLSDAPFYLPIEIWNLHELRHLECMGFDVPDPSSAAKGNGDGWNDSFSLKKLLTLSGVSAHSCTQGILARMPNLIKLGILIDSRHDDGAETFSFYGDYTDLCRLESFKWVFEHPYPESKVVFSGLTFSDNLGKITLSGCGFSWEYMTYIGRLPNLEVLKLQCFAFRGPVWATTEGEFLKLRFLLLGDLDIEHWKVNSDEHFPLLRRLIIRHCYKLRSISSEFKFVSTLQIIEVDDCGPSLVDSAQKLQKSVGNHLQVRIHSSWDDKTRKS